MGNYLGKASLIIRLQEKGYDKDFILKNEGILYIQENELVRPEEFFITETYLLQGHPKPSHNFVFYAIRLVHSDTKGILMTSFSTYNRGVSFQLWSKLSENLRRALDMAGKNLLRGMALN